MESGFSQSVNDLLLDNIVENIPITNNGSIPVMNHQNLKEIINPAFR